MKNLIFKLTKNYNVIVITCGEAFYNELLLDKNITFDDNKFKSVIVAYYNDTELQIIRNKSFDDTETYYQMLGEYTRRSQTPSITLPEIALTYDAFLYNSPRAFSILMSENFKKEKREVLPELKLS